MAGYYAVLIGKYGLQGSGSSAAQWPAYPTKRGFDYYYGYVRHADGHQHYPANTWALGNSDAHRSTKELWENNNEVSADLDKCYTADLFTAKAKQVIIDRAENHPSQPFFMYLAYDTPHGALQLPAVAYPEGKGVDGGIQWIDTPGRMINTAEGTIDSYRDPLYTGMGLSDVGVRSATAITRLDHCIGDVLQTLRDLGIDSNTVVVFSSDNGPHNESYIQGQGYSPQVFQSYGPFEGMKRDTYEGGIRVPTLAWGPANVKAGQLSTQLSQFHDWMATFCDYDGVERPARIDGVSLRPTLTGSDGQEEGTVYVEYTTGGSMPNYADWPNHGGTTRNEAQVIYLDGYKGIRNNATSHSVDFKIYDTLEDKAEADNLAGTSDYFIELQQRMKHEVLRLRMPNESAARSYDNEPVPAVIAESPVNGIIVKAYEGEWDWVPEFTIMQETGAWFDSAISLDRLQANSNAGLLLTGFLSVPENGTWTFSSISDGGIIFKLHKKLVLDADYRYDGSEISQSVILEQGLHPFRLYYRTGADTPEISLQWSGPGVTKETIPAANLFREEAAVPVIRRETSRMSNSKAVIDGRRLDGKKVPAGFSSKYLRTF
jgi:uncharacterized sulfatase